MRLLQGIWLKNARKTKSYPAIRIDPNKAFNIDPNPKPKNSPLGPKNTKITPKLCQLLDSKHLTPTRKLLPWMIIPQNSF